jgi:proteasome lid subunit RPN8/RPN11
MPLQPTFGSWSVSGSPLKIEYALHVLEEIRAEAVDGYHRIRHGGVEVGGVLFGSQEGHHIRILERRAFRCEYARGPTFTLSGNDQTALDALIGSPATDPGLSGLMAVGWYHSHTRSGISLSENDLALHDRHFPAPWQIAMVVRPLPDGSAEVGFFTRQADGAICPGEAQGVFQCNPIQTPARLPEAALERLNGGLESQNKPGRPLRSWVWLAAALVLAFAAVGVLANVFHIGGPPDRSGLGLRASERDGLLRIEWDQSAQPVRSAQRASLVIMDGAQKTEKTLTPEFLQTGRILYLRQTPEIEIRLKVDGANSESAHEEMRLVGLPGKPAAAAARLPAPVPHSEPVSKKPDPERLRAADARPTSKPSLEAPLALEPPPLPPQSLPRWTSNTPPASAPPAPKAALVERSNRAYQGPKTGRLIWNGRLAPGAALRIHGNKASTGYLTGQIPNARVTVKAYPAELSGNGIHIYTRNAKGRQAGSEKPSAGNGWLGAFYKRNPKRASDLVVLETPSGKNDWQRVAVRARNRTLTAIVVDWEVLPESAQ